MINNDINAAADFDPNKLPSLREGYTYPIIEEINIKNLKTVNKYGRTDIVTISAVFHLNGRRYTTDMEQYFDAYVHESYINEIHKIEIKDNAKYCIKIKSTDEMDDSFGICELEILEVDKDIHISELMNTDYIIGTFETDSNESSIGNYGLYKEGTLEIFPKLMNQEKLSKEDVGFGLDVDEEGLPCINRDIVETNEDVERKLENKADKSKLELIRRFTIGDETTYKDKDLYIFEDEAATKMKKARIVCDNNGNQIRLKKAIIKYTYPARKDTETPTNYPIVATPMAFVGFSEDGYIASDNGYKSSNGYQLINSGSEYKAIQYIDYINDMSFKQSFYGVVYNSKTNTDAFNTIQRWVNGDAFVPDTDWGKIEKANGMTGILLYLHENSVIKSLPEGTIVQIYGVRV